MVIVSVLCALLARRGERHFSLPLYELGHRTHEEVPTLRLKPITSIWNRNDQAGDMVQYGESLVLYVSVRS